MIVFSDLIHAAAPEMIRHADGVQVVVTPETEGKPFLHRWPYLYLDSTTSTETAEKSDFRTFGGRKLSG